MKQVWTTYVDHVVGGTVLRDGDKRRLVVRRGVDRRELVKAAGETAGDVCAEDAVHGNVVEALEEREVLRIHRLSGCERGDLLYDGVRVPLGAP